MKNMNVKTITTIGLAVSLIGCAALKGLTFLPDMQAFKKEYRAGRYEQAIKTIMPNNIQTFNEQDFGFYSGIVGLEAGSASMAGNKLEDSVKYFDMAEKVQTGHFGINTYRAKYYDKIMLNTYKGILLWKLGNLETAQIEFNRLYSVQAEAVKNHEREIAEAEKKLTEQEGSIEGLDATQKILNNEYTVFKNFKPYADFTNPFSTYISSLFYLTTKNSSSNVENAVNYMKRLETMSDNPYLKKDIEMAENVANKKEIGSHVWVIYEEGVISEVKEKRIQIPFPTKSGIKIANLVLPEFKEQPHSFTHLNAKTSDGVYKTQELADMERVIKTEYLKNYPIEVSKAVVYMIVNLALQEVAAQAVEESSFAKKLDKKMSKHGGLLGDLGKNKLGSKALASGAAVAISQVEYKIDTEAWTSLPKEIQMARFDMPKDRIVKLSTPNGKKIADIKIEKNVNNALIYVRSPAKQAIFSTFTINMN